MSALLNQVLKEKYQELINAQGFSVNFFPKNNKNCCTIIRQVKAHDYEILKASRYCKHRSQYGQSQSEKKNKDFSTSTTTVSNYIQESASIEIPPFRPNLLSKCTSTCENCETRFT